MSDLKYCQGPECHTFKTKDRIKGPKGSKSYQTRRRSQFYYGKNNFCDLRCMNMWIQLHIEQALNHFGRTTEPKKTMCDQAWYKDYKWVRQDSNRTVYNHYFVNDLLGQKIPITQSQYNDENIITPNNLSQ